MEMQSFGKILRERNIKLDTRDPVAQGGFTQVPNFILKDAELSIGAKLTYAMFLSYAWHNDSCFPGQERLAADMGMSRSRVGEFVGELSKRGVITIKRRGLGKTNIYTIHFKVKKPSAQRNRSIQMSISRHPDVGRLTSGRRPTDIFL